MSFSNHVSSILKLARYNTEMNMSVVHSCMVWSAAVESMQLDVSREHIKEVKRTRAQ